MNDRADISRRGWLLGMAALAGCTPICLTRPAYAATPPPAAVIVISSKIEVTSVSLGELRRCFLGHEVKLADARLIPFNHPPDRDLRVLFDEKVLGMSPVESQRYWINSLIRGGPRPPRKVKDPNLLARVVATLRGAISYVDPETAEKTPGIRVLAIDGIAPDDARYPLRP